MTAPSFTCVLCGINRLIVLNRGGCSAGAGVLDADDAAMHAEHASAQRRLAANKQEKADARQARAIMQRCFEGAVAAAAAGAARTHDTHAQQIADAAVPRGKGMHRRATTPHGTGKVRDASPEPSQQARDAKRDEREMLFAKHHVDLDTREAFAADRDAHRASRHTHAGHASRNAFRPSLSPQGRSREPLCLLYTSPSPRDRQKSRMPSSA